MLKRPIWLMVVLIGLLAACGFNGSDTLPTFTPPPSQTPLPPTPTPIPVATLPPAATLPPPIPQVDSSADPVHIRFVQGNPSLERVDIYANYLAVAARFFYGAYSGEPVDLPSGEYVFRVVPSGQPNSPSNALYEQTLRLEGNNHLLMVLYGTAEDIRLLQVEDDLSPLPVDTARVQLIQAVADSPDLTLLADGVAWSEAFSYETTETLSEVTVGDYELNIRAGTGSLLNSTVTIKPQTAYNVLLIGDRTLGKLDVVVLSQETLPQTQFRIIHAGYDQPRVKVFLDDFLVIENLGYGDFSDRFITFNAGSYQLRVEAMTAAPTDPPLLETRLLLEANGLADLILYAEDRQMTAQLYPLSTAPLDEFLARINIINLVPSREKLRVSLGTLIAGDDFTPDNTMLDFGEAMFPATISVGYQIIQFYSVNPDNTEVKFYESPELPIEGNIVYTYLLMGRLGMDSQLLVLPLNEDLVNAETTPTEPIAPTYARFINALSDQTTLRLQSEGETLVEGLAYGFASDSIPVLSDASLPVIAQDMEGNTLFDLSFQSIEGEETTLVLAGSVDAPQLYLLPQVADTLAQSGSAEGLFLNALPSFETIALNYYPLDYSEGGVLDNPDLKATPDYDLIRKGIGDQITLGQFERVELFTGDYQLEIRDVQVNRIYGEAFFSVEAGNRYEFILFEQNGEISLLTISRPLAEIR